MQVCQVPFCGGTAYGLRSDADKAAIIDELWAVYGIRVPDAGAGPLRYAAAEHAREIRGGGHAASLRPRGTPHYLFLTRAHHAAGNGICAFVERRVNDGHFYPRVTLVRMQFPERAFDGTVLEGDMVCLRQQKRPMPPNAANLHPLQQQQQQQQQQEQQHTRDHDRDRKQQGPGRWVFVVGDLRADGGHDLRGVEAAVRRERLAWLLSPESHRPDLVSDPCFLRMRPAFPAAPFLRDVVERGLGDLDYEVASVVFRAPQARLGCPGDEDVAFTLPHLGFDPSRRTAPASPPQSAALAASDPPGQSRDVGGAATAFGGEAGAPVLQEQPRDRFFVRRTDLPDVFELYRTAAEAAAGPAPGTEGSVPIAGVPSMRASALLRAAAGARPPAPVEFELSSRFGKWTPCFD